VPIIKRGRTYPERRLPQKQDLKREERKRESSPPTTVRASVRPFVHPEIIIQKYSTESIPEQRLFVLVHFIASTAVSVIVLLFFILFV